MSGVFLDTSAIYAAARAGTDRHSAAKTEYERLLRGRVGLITTDLVLAELHALTLSRSRPAVALELVDRLLRSSRIDVVDSGVDRIRSAAEFLRDRPNRRYSLADAVSFVVMRDLGVEDAFTLDADFGAEGFRMLPDRG